jgi:mannose-6-phosphate isomerase-like protein (cupin superfamily)
MLHTPISTGNAAHYEWGSGCDGWHLVKAAAFSVIEERMPPGTNEVRHWHARARQFFYVLDGTLELEVEGALNQLTRGCGLEIPPGLAHQARNSGESVVSFLVVSSPPHQGDRRESGAQED